MDRDQTGDERHTIENKGQVDAISGMGGVRERAVDSRASMTQNQSSVLGQTSQSLSVRGSVIYKRKTDTTFLAGFLLHVCRVMRWSLSNVQPPPALQKLTGVHVENTVFWQTFYFLVSVVCKCTCYGAVIFYRTRIIISSFLLKLYR